MSPSLIPPSADHRSCVRDPRASGVPDLTIIVPAYNERSRLPATLRELSGYFPEPVEILVVDDGSDDGTWEIASKALEGTRHAFAVLRQEANQGKGRAVRSGMLRARGRRWLVIDADGATPIAEWEKLRERLDAGADIAIGSRAMPGSRIRTRQPWYRRPLGPCFNLLVRAILFRGIRDTQCGFKAYQPEVARVLCRRQRIDGFSFDPETLFLALRSGCRVEEVGVAWDDRAGSKVRVLSDALRMLRDLLRVRFYAASGLYDRDPAGVRRSAASPAGARARLTGDALPDPDAALRRSRRDLPGAENLLLRDLPSGLPAAARGGGTFPFEPPNAERRGPYDVIP